MKKFRQAKILFIATILAIILSICFILVGFIVDMWLLIVLGLISTLYFIMKFKINAYPFFITFNPNRKHYCKPLTAEETQIIEDAKNLIKCVDKSITISDFSVYKVSFVSDGWFHYDKDTQELSIFIPFKKYVKFGKDFCFLAFVHEMLHSQNLKSNLDIFTDKFLEGLNHLLSVWLIENYSQKYQIPKHICIVKLNLGRNISLVLHKSYNIYEEEVAMVQEILDKSGIDLREIFLKYINLDPEFFKSFVPPEYFLSQ